MLIQIMRAFKKIPKVALESQSKVLPFFPSPPEQVRNRHVNRSVYIFLSFTRRQQSSKCMHIYGTE